MDVTHARVSSGATWQDHVSWTVGLTAFLTVLNAGLFSWAPAPTRNVANVLQFDGVAVRHGEWWRLLTGNLVHWGPGHFLLDVTGFLVLGLLYERSFGRAFPVLFLVTALAIGTVGRACWPARTLMRGLSGVDWGLFAAGLCVEFRRCRRAPWRLLWVLPTAGLFVFGLVYQEVTGRLFAGPLLVSSVHTLAPFAHLTGAVTGFTFAAGCLLLRRFGKNGIRSR